MKSGCSIDFVIELAEGGVGIIEKKTSKASNKKSQVNLEWSLSSIEPELFQTILRAIKLNRPVFFATYNASRVYEGNSKKNLTGFKVSLARATADLKWQDMFPDDPIPADAQWTVVAQSAKKQGGYLVIVHTSKNGKSRQVNEYKIEIARISNAIYDSTTTFKTFPFNIPHSHKITEDKVVTYDRSIDDWEQHVEAKGLLEDSKVQNKLCSNCRASFFDTSSHQLCYSCFTAEQKIARNKAIGLCKQAEKFASQTDWKETADAMKQLQKDWQQLHSLPRSDSEKLWLRFQAATQGFFDARSKFFDRQDKLRTANKKKAERLITEAKKIAGSSNWKETADTLKRFQKDWKKVNPLPREDADQLWRNFQDVCQAFFDRRAAYYEKKRG